VRIKGTRLLAGDASGLLLALEAPLSFWGGLDPESGAVIDQRHPQAGAVVTDRILLMPGGRGSSSSSTVLAEAIRRGSGPAGIILTEADDIIVLGALVAEELYRRTTPVVLVKLEELRSFPRTGRVTIASDGTIKVG